MSGVIGMNDWEKSLEAGRRHVARLLNEQSMDEGGLGDSGFVAEPHSREEGFEGTVQKPKQSED